MSIEPLLETMIARQASDLHVQAGAIPHLRIGGELYRLDAGPPADEELQAFVDAVIHPVARRDLQRKGSCDLAVSYGDARLRVNVFRQQGQLALAIRRLSLTVPGFDELNLPAQLQAIAERPRGLVLVAGTTSSGKSTTIAAMIGHINRTRKARILTVEDPIEYVHTPDRSLISQIEIGADTPDYEQALRQLLRQDPDAIMVGELREAVGIRVALRAADTGHLVFATVHAADARQTIERLIAMFPHEEHTFLLKQLSLNLAAVIAQRLGRSCDPQLKGGLIPAVEILRGTAVVRKCILEGRYDGLLQAMNNRDEGMQTFDNHLAELFRAKRIKEDEAKRLSSHPEALDMVLRGLTTRDSGRGLVR